MRTFHFGLRIRGFSKESLTYGPQKCVTSLGKKNQPNRFKSLNLLFKVDSEVIFLVCNHAKNGSKGSKGPFGGPIPLEKEWAGNRDSDGTKSRETAGFSWL